MACSALAVALLNTVCRLEAQQQVGTANNRDDAFMAVDFEAS